MGRQGYRPLKEKHRSETALPSHSSLLKHDSRRKGTLGEKKRWDYTTKQGITIFVPKDSAFASLKKSDLGNLTQDQLRILFLYHAFPMYYYSLSDFKNLSKLNSVSTFAGEQYGLNVTYTFGVISIDSDWANPKITSSVYSTAPVAVYEINGVLLPLAIFSSDPPLAPAPAPAPETMKSLSHQPVVVLHTSPVFLS
ncbi:hypothetical protein BHE74_00041808 [Ensete ventricosum]|nr:hypothetical protein BHE74_00041808 [Ensete ventricosum]